MIDETTLNDWLARINLPERDLRELSFCASNKPSRVQAWVQELPMTRVSYVCSLLYQALPEVARLQIGPGQRLEMLESLRPAVQQSIESLSQQFLNQPVILPEPARKAATVAMALQKHLSNAYLVAVADFARTPDNSEALPLWAQAIHRSITGLGLLLLRSYQLYTPRPAQLWNELHALYGLAESAQLHQLPVHDPLPHHEQLNTIQLTYVRLLLMATAHPNQLRQDEITATYWALEELAPQARLLTFSAGQKDSLYAVALDGNQPPQYKTRLPHGAHNVRELDTSQIVAALRTEKPPSGRHTRNRYGLLPPLNEHLIRAWNLLSQRSFERRSARGQVELTVGLSNVHFHLSGQIPFKLFLDQAGGVDDDRGNPFNERRPAQPEHPADADDPWGGAFDAGKLQMAGGDLPSFNIERAIKQQHQKEYQGEHPIYAVSIVDTSLGGYCLEWREQIPSQVKAGELLGVREQGRRKWSLAVVRWMRQSRNATLLGLQVLAPNAVALAAAVVQKTDAPTEYLRVLQVPALKAIDQPTTLITNALSFHEYSKVQLYRPAGTSTDESTPTVTPVQLTRRCFSTGAISQFEFRTLSAGSPPAPTNGLQM